MTICYCLQYKLLVLFYILIRSKSGNTTILDGILT